MRRRRALRSVWPGVDYTVSTSGSDAASGKIGSPWQTVARVNAQAFNPGDRVFFQGGQTFAGSLQPPVPGIAGAPVTFGSFGTGKATLSSGWFIGPGINFITVQDLISTNGVQGGGAGGPANNIVMQRNDIQLPGGNNTSVGIIARGAHWLIAYNTINGSGDSGMLLGLTAGNDTGGSDDFEVAHNTVTNSGTNSTLSYGLHAIYLKVTNAYVHDNTLTGFRSDGVSCRYHNARVESNAISSGAIGVAWFQYDTVAGSTSWRSNNISAVTAAGMFVSASDAGGLTRESFVIEQNTIAILPGANYLDLRATSGTYTVDNNIEI